jgi:hypothetical protein
MEFLIENKKDSRATLGLLRLVNGNRISFSTFPINMLMRFQSTYEQVILQFFKNFANVKPQVTESLPGTSFFFTTPLLEALNSGGETLHHQMPYKFLPYIIEILCYSFTEDRQSFSNFLITFKEGCKKFYY